MWSHFRGPDLEGIHCIPRSERFHCICIMLLLLLLFTVVVCCFTASLLPKPRTYSMTTSYRSVPNIHPDHTHHYSAQHQRVATPISPGLRPITSAVGMGGTNSSSGKPFSMSADNLDSDPCLVSTTATATAVTSTRANLPQPSTKEVRGHLATPTSYSRGILSVSMSNMQTHV